MQNPPSQAVAQLRSFSIDDLYLHRHVTELAANPARDEAAGVVRQPHPRGGDDDGYASHLWLFAPGTEPRPLTQGSGADSQPRWSPDGTQLAFVSDRGGDQQQVHLLPRDGGEARALGHFDQGAGSPVWAPDGRSLLVLGTVLADPDQRPGGSGIDRGASGAEVCWRLPYKADGVGWLLGRTVHLFRLDVASGTHTQLTQGAFDVLAAAPSPDGERIAFIRTRTGRFAHCADLWICNADGSGARCLETGLATAIAPAWSPDGRWIAMGGAVREGDGQIGLWLVDVASGKAQPLGEGDLEVADAETLHWSADGQTVHLLEAERGRHRLIAV